ncbi:histidine phosphatase family protein [Fructilactobacillus fructivorans]|uniref:histidine phosphatase family protein n=1 Tax=Fructilactobacillus fructivorans TaxID=1614 RepID=UPI00070FE89F|nr:histidine phosphatase family protein [Fructilactobacillus fructivorans]KRN40401.1 phosphoglycerate mutase [Fructilactobacillus fructivorans]
MTSLNLYFVRHGQTYLNRYHRLQGWADSALTDKGITDAIDAGKHLSKINFDKAYSSDTKRARDTAELILKENPSGLIEPIEMENLREENFGYFEGNDMGQVWHIIGGPSGADSYSQMIETYTMEKTRDMIADADPYGDAENDSQFWQRVQTGLDEIVNNAEDGDDILITAHGTFIRSIVSQFSDIDISDPIHNGSVTKIEYKDGDYVVKYYNNISDPV